MTDDGATGGKYTDRPFALPTRGLYRAASSLVPAARDS
jgi:hypothetical protein